MPAYPAFPAYPQAAPMSYPMAMAAHAPGMVAGAAAPMMPAQFPGAPGFSTLPAAEESYIENILRLNLGKVATIYMTFENNSQWNAKIFRGRLEAAGRDHIIISDPQTGLRYLLLMVNLDYITFEQELNYDYPSVSPFPTGR
nr:MULTISPECIES: spore coat protein GerQ [unclassified Paenibacillus]